MVTNNLQIIKNILELYQDVGVNQIPHYISKESLQGSLVCTTSLNQSTTSSVISNKKIATIHSNTIEKVATTHNPITNKNNVITPSLITSNTNKHVAPPIQSSINNSQYEFLNSINTLDGIKEELLKFNGCDLKRTAMNTVFGVGNANADIMLIGEAPGADEDIKGEPFVGRSGQLLMQALASIKLHRENLFITNTVFWRPPGNRNPTLEEMVMCYPFLTKMISLIRPKIIILVGKVATTNILKLDDPISKICGVWYNTPFIFNKETINVETTVVFHPAYLLRNPIKKQVLWQDLLNIRAKINDLNLNI